MGKVRAMAVILLGVVLGLASPGEAAELHSSLAAAPPVIDFDAAARLALRQSPHFTKSALEIEVRRLDEKDSKADFLPAVNLRTRYYANQPSRAGLSDPNRYVLDINTEDYNPLLAYFGLKVRKIITQIAVLSHLKVISAGLRHLGQGFLEMEALKNLAVSQAGMVDLASRHPAYAQRRLDLGEASPLEVQIALQEVEVAQAEGERLGSAREKMRDGLKGYLGVKPEERPTFDPGRARTQVLGPFNARDATLEKFRAQSFDLKIQALKKELQSWRVVLAKVKLLPSLTMGVQTPDPLYLTGVRGHFFSVGLSWPVFEGFKGWRDINRQQTVLKQAASELETTETDLGNQWREAQDRLKSAALALKLARSQAELARLKERQGEIRHQAGEPLTVWLPEQRARMEAERQVVLKTLEHDLAALELRHLAGDLLRQYVDEKSWEQ